MISLTATFTKSAEKEIFINVHALLVLLKKAPKRKDILFKLQQITNKPADEVEALTADISPITEEDEIALTIQLLTGLSPLQIAASLYDDVEVATVDEALSQLLIWAEEIGPHFTSLRINNRFGGQTEKKQNPAGPIPKAWQDLVPKKPGTMFFYADVGGNMEIVISIEYH